MEADESLEFQFLPETVGRDRRREVEPLHLVTSREAQELRFGRAGRNPGARVSAPEERQYEQQDEHGTEYRAPVGLTCFA